jgi:leader peptidase (prepilin peptidase)/N-methyltransferase
MHNHTHIPFNPMCYSIAIITGFLLSIVIFWLYQTICLSFSNKSYQSQYKFSILKTEKIPFITMIIFSVLVANILLYEIGYQWQLFIAAIFAYAMLLLAAIDFKTQLLPDIITKPLIILGLVQGYFNVFTDFQNAALGAIAGYLILWSVNFAFRLVRGIDGMGYGDFKLLSAIGAWCGINMLPLVILASSIIGIFIALIILKLTKANMQAPTPFGPSLVITGFVAFLYGNDIIDWYIKILQMN